jgi:hypothetical protein
LEKKERKKERETAEAAGLPRESSSKRLHKHRFPSSHPIFFPTHAFYPYYLLLLGLITKLKFIFILCRESSDKHLHKSRRNKRLEDEKAATTSTTTTTTSAPSTPTRVTTTTSAQTTPSTPEEASTQPAGDDSDEEEVCLISVACIFTYVDIIILQKKMSSFIRTKGQAGRRLPTRASNRLSLPVGAFKTSPIPPVTTTSSPEKSSGSGSVLDVAIRAQGRHKQQEKEEVATFYAIFVYVTTLDYSDKFRLRREKD